MTAGNDRPPGNTPDKTRTGAANEVGDALPRTDIDLESELEGLRDYLVKGHSMLNHRLWIPLEDIEERFEQIIALLPKEVRRARNITRNEQRILSDAKDEARRIIEEARAESEQIVTSSREEADRLVEQSAIRQRALEQAEATIAKAEGAAGEIRRQSYAYANQVMLNVETSLRRLTQSVETDKSQLEQMGPE